MPKRRYLVVSAEARAELVAVRDHDAHPQMRERAAALLKIADGMSPHAVAQHGLLRRRDPDAIYGWMNWYETEGIAGLRAHLHGGSPRGRLRRRPGTRPGPAATGGGGST
jgi:Helix-turn-helix domain